MWTIRQLCATPTTWEYSDPLLCCIEPTNFGSAVNEFIHFTLRGDILGFKEPIETDDVLKADDKICLVEEAPGIGKSTLAWDLWSGYGGVGTHA